MTDPYTEQIEAQREAAGSHRDAPDNRNPHEGPGRGPRGPRAARGAPVRDEGDGEAT